MPRIFLQKRICDSVIISFIIISLLIQSCAPSLPKNSAQQLTIPQSFPNGSSNQDLEDLVKKDFRIFFNDEQLVTLIEIALKNNQELKILEQEVNIANNEVRARQGQYLPKVEVEGGYQLEKTGEASRQGVVDKSANLPEKLRNRELAATMSWEIDIWKKLRNFAKSSYLQYLASIEGKNFAVTQLVAEVARDYYELMSLDNQQEIVGQFLKTLDEARQVVELQKIAGRTTSLAVKRFDAELLKNQGRQYSIAQQITVTENHLNQLLGRLPQHIDRPSQNFMKLTLPEVAAGIPTALLDNRPDVKQATLQIEASKLNVKAVKAQFYPALNIVGSAGYETFNANHFLNPSSLFYNLASGITVPLLNRKAIKADYFTANSKQIEAVYNYEQTFIKAFAEVSNQLAAVKNLWQIYDLKSQQTKTLGDSFEISNILFKAARIDYLESLLTRRDYLESQLELTEIKQQQLAAYVNLYRALGGGWARTTELSAPAK